MSYRNTIKKKLNSNLPARIIFRIVCGALIIAGLLLSYMGLRVVQRYQAYTARNSEATATIQRIEKATGNYAHKTCKISYDFKLADRGAGLQENYSSETSPERIATGASCYLYNGQRITISYDKNNPENNAFNDNAFSQTAILAVATSLLGNGMLALGMGWVGLKALKRSLREARDKVANEAKRYYRRSPKIAKKTD